MAHSVCVVAQYVALLHPTEHKVLVLEQKSLTDESTSWCLPGGTLDKDETLEAGLRREVLEEVGIDTEDFSLFRADTSFSKKNNMTKLSLFYTGKAVSTAIQLSEEHLRYRWCTFDEVINIEFQKPKGKDACLAAFELA